MASEESHPAMQRWNEAIQKLKVRERELYNAIEDKKPDVVSLKAGIEKVEEQLNALWVLVNQFTDRDYMALMDHELLEPMDFLDYWAEELYDADRGLFTEAWHVIARLMGQAEADQEERTTAVGDDEVGDDDDAEDPDGSHEGRGARTEQASHTAEDAVAAVVHLLTADHATLEGSSEMVDVDNQDLGDVMPVMVPPEDYQDLATHIGEEHVLEAEEMDVALNKACQYRASHLGKPKFNMRVSAEVVEDIKAEPRDLATPIKLGMVEDLPKDLLIAVGHVVVSEVMPGLTALGRAGLPRGQQVHGYLGGGDVQVEPGGSCLLYEQELPGVIAKYIGAEPAAASSDILELYKVWLSDLIGGDNAIAKMLEVNNSVKAVPGVQLHAEDLRVGVGVIKSVISYQEEVSMYEVNYLQGVYYKQDYDYLNTESDKTQFIQVSVTS